MPSQARTDMEQQTIEGASTSDAVGFITVVQSLKRKIKNWEKSVEVCNITLHYINTNEIPGDRSHENLISSHVKISTLLWLHSKSRLSHQKPIKVKWFGISLVFI